MKTKVGFDYYQDKTRQYEYNNRLLSLLDFLVTIPLVGTHTLTPESR